MSRSAGEFRWVELATPDLERALEFYGTLFGWLSARPAMGTIDGRELSYALLRLGDRDLGGAYEMIREQRERGDPPHWLPYVAVDSVADFSHRAELLGATLLVDPIQVFDVGWMCVLEDPDGARVALWESDKIGILVGDDPGMPCGFELSTPTPARALEFYGALFGWQAPASGSGASELLLEDGRPARAWLRALPDAPPGWTVRFAVTDLAASARRLVELGGALAGSAPPQDGTPVAVRDPLGAPFALHRA